MGNLPESSQSRKVKFVTQIYVSAFFLFRSEEFLEIESTFPSWYREGNTMTNGDFLYKYKFALQMGYFQLVFKAEIAVKLSQNNLYA